MKNRKKLVSILAGIMAAILLLTLILGILPTHAHAASSSEIQKQIAALKKEKAELEEQIKDVKAQYQANEDEIADIVARKNVIDQEINILYAQTVNINEQISSYNVLIADKQDELDTAELHYQELNEKNKERVRAMEEDGTLSYWEVIFKASSFSDLLDRLNIVAEIAASDKRRLQELSDAADVVRDAQSALETEKDALELTKEELDATQTALDDKRAELDDLIQELLSKGEALEELEKEFQKQKTDFLDEIAQKEKEYNEAKHQEWLAYMATYTTVPPTTTAPPTTTNNGSSTNSGNSNNNSGGNNATSNASWLRPCNYRKLTSPFGLRKSPTAGASTYHQGVDLSAPKGTPIYATRTGVVTVSSYSNAAGNYVSINHGDGFSSIYMHMETRAVRSGQAVSAGQLIGYVGNSGITTGYHLHFGISYNGAYVNPCNYVNLP